MPVIYIPTMNNGLQQVWYEKNTCWAYCSKNKDLSVIE